MERKLKAIALIFAIIMGFGITERAEARTEVTLDVFYDALSPYGEWIQHDYYGYIWQPVGVDEYWQPYRDGNWQYSDEGWIWVSGEPWGWATYHYGRWVPDEYYGWVWIPGVDWAPAYVEWYDSPGYIGWAPRPPDRNFFLEIGISVGGYGYYQPGYAFNFSYYKPYKRRHRRHHHHKRHHYYAPPEHCVYVPYEHFSHKNAKLVAVGGPYNTVVHRNTTNITNVTVINNKTVYKGPDRHHVERRSGKKIKRIDVVERDTVTYRGGRDLTKVRGNKYEVYRPKVVKSGHERPKSISKRHNGKRGYEPGYRKGMEKLGASENHSVVNRSGGNLRGDFTKREGYKQNANQKYGNKYKAGNRGSTLAPVKSPKLEVNRDINSNSYKSQSPSRYEKTYSNKNGINRDRGQRQYRNKSENFKLTGNSSKNSVSNRSKNFKAIKSQERIQNSKKPLGVSNKSLSPAKNQRDRAAYSSQKNQNKSRSLNKAQRQKSYTNRQVNKSYTYKKPANKSNSKNGVSRNPVKRSFNNSRQSFDGFGQRSLNRQVRR